MRTQRMVRVSVEVCSGTVRFRVSVQAKNIRRALGLVGGRYPHGEVRLVFPVEPEGFFVCGPSTPIGVIGDEQVHEVAA
jgi:hypothetical protein